MRICIYCKKFRKRKETKYCSRKCYAEHKKILISNNQIRMPDNKFVHEFRRGKNLEQIYGEDYAKEIRLKLKKAREGKKPTKGRIMPEEEKERRRQIYINSPDIQQKIKEARSRQKFPFQNTLIEKKMQTILDYLKIPYMKQKYIEDIEDKYRADFHIPILNIIIECDGDYWHKFNKARDRDRRRTIQLREKGYVVLRFSELTINQNEKFILENLKIISNIINDSEIKIQNYDSSDINKIRSERIKVSRIKYNKKNREILRYKRIFKLEQKKQELINKGISRICVRCGQKFIPLRDKNYPNSPNNRFQKYCNINCLRGKHET